MLSRLRARLTRRPPQPEQPLPDYGLRYFDHLWGAYQVLPIGTSVPDEYRAVLNDLISKRTQNAAVTWRDLYTFELILANLQPLESLRNIVWNLRYRYRDVAGLREYDAYLASKPPELGPGVQVQNLHNDLKADISYLLGQIHLRYAMAPIRERLHTGLMRIVKWLLVISLLFILFYDFGMRFLYIGWGNWRQYLPPSMLTVVAVVGAIGGLISVQQRFQSASNEGDPVYNLSVFAQGRKDIWPSIFSGGIFAAVLYLLVAAGLLSGELFPEMWIASTSTTFEQKTYEQGYLIWFLQNALPKEGHDYAKLLIWSFIAGFAERFVPDTLSRFVERRQTESGPQA
jgi:hypothetical protein